MKYLVSYKDPDRHFIDFKLIVETKGRPNFEVTTSFLETW